MVGLDVLYRVAYTILFQENSVFSLWSLHCYKRASLVGRENHVRR